MTAKNITISTPFAMWGVLIIFIGIFLYLMGVFIASINKIITYDAIFYLSHNLVWYSGIPIIVGIALILHDIILIVPKKRKNKILKNNPPKNSKLVVTLTAYNDEKSIYKSVMDFKKHKLVSKVIVVSNNSTDKTISEAKRAGAEVYNETKQGYGACVYRCLKEATKLGNDFDLMVLCEGDMSFRASDINKLLSYINHADIVLGTRIVESLQAKNTQLSTFMHYGNLFVAKLLELKYLASVTLSDVGTTYKICRISAIKKMVSKLDNNINLSFNPYFLEKAIKHNLQIVECPITFFPRIGFSKGGNINNYVAIKLGLQMIFGILFGWGDKFEK